MVDYPVDSGKGFETPSPQQLSSFPLIFHLPGKQSDDISTSLIQQRPSSKQHKIAKTVKNILDLQRRTPVAQAEASNNKEWQKSLQAEDKKITSLWRSLLADEEIGDEESLKASFDQIDSYLKAFEEQIESFGKRSDIDTDDSIRTIAHAQQVMLAARILMQYRHTDAAWENTQITLQLQLDASRERVIDYKMDNYAAVVSRAQSLADLYREASSLPAELKLPLIKQIRNNLKEINDAQADFQDMRATIQEKISSVQKDVKTANDKLCRSTKMNTKGLIDTYRQLEQAKATLQFLQNKLAEAEALLSIIAPPKDPQESPQFSLNKTIGAITAIPRGLIGIGKGAAGFGADVVKALKSGRASLVTSIEEKLQDEEERMARELAKIQEQASTDTTTFAEMRKKNDVLLTDQSGSEKFYELLLDQKPNALQVLLSQPLVEFRDIPSERLSQKDYLQAKKDLALVFSLAEKLPASASQEIKDVIDRIKIRAVEFLKKEEKPMAESLYATGVAQEEELDRLKKAEQWQALRLKEIEELEAGPSPERIRALNLFFFVLHAGTWIKSASDIIGQGNAMQRAHDAWLTKVRSEVPKDVEKTAGFIGTVLSDKLQSIQTMKPDELRKFCKVDPDTGKSKFAGAYEVLNEVLISRGNNTNPLTREEISTIQETFLLSTLRPESGPFAHMNFSKWLSLLTEVEDEPKVSKISPESLAVDADLVDAVLNDSTSVALVVGKTSAETAKVTPALAASISLPYVSADSILANSALTILASQSASLNQLHIFLASSGDSIDSSIFAHLIGHANPMIEKGQHAGTKLVGLNPIDAISYQLGVAEAMLRAMQQAPSGNQDSLSMCCGAILGDPSIADSVRNNPKLLEDLVRQLQIAQSIERPLVDPRLDVNDYRARIIDNVGKLKPGQSFFMSGGWITRGAAGHTMSWVVTKQTDEKLTIRLHNTGAGIERHFSANVDLEARSLLFTEIEDIDPDQFTGGSFIQGMFNIQKVKLPEDAVDWGENEIYNSLLIGLGGVLSTRQYSHNELAQPQFVGICSMEAIMEAINTSVESETSAIIYRFWTTLKGTTSYFDQVKDYLILGAGSEERRRLLHDGLKVMSSLANKALEAGALTDAELEYTSTMIKYMNQHLKQVERQVAVQTVEQEPSITFAVPSHSLQSIERKPGFYSKEQMRSTEIIRPLVSIESEAFSANPTTIISDLKKLLHEVHLGNHERHNYLEVQKAIRGIALKIPLQDTSFWNHIDDATANELLSIFAEMSQEFLWSAINNDERPKNEKLLLFSDDYLCQAKLLTLADYIGQHYKNPLGITLPSLVQKKFLIFNGSILRASPDWKEQFNLMFDYWKKVWESNIPEEIREEGFFGFDSYPAGNTAKVYSTFNKNDDFLNLKKEKGAQYLSEQKSVPRQWLFGESNHPYTIFLKQWAINNPEKVKEIDPEISTKSLDDQVVDLLKNIDKLPQLQNAFIISYVYDYLLSGSLGKPNESQEVAYDFSKGIKMEVGEFRQEVKLERAGTKALTCSGVKYSLFGRAPYIDPEEAINSPFINTSGGPKGTFKWETIGPTYVNPFSHLVKAQTKLDDLLNKVVWEVNNIYYASRWRLDSNDVTIIDPSRSNKWDNNKGNLHEMQISVEQFRELMSLSSVSALQIKLSVKYFSDNSMLLHKPEYQIFFRFLMTEGRLLNAYIKENPNATAEIAAFYDKILKSTEKGEVNTIIFLAGMSSRLQEIFELEKRKNPELFLTITAPQFLDARHTLNNLIQSEDVTDEQHALANRELAISFRRQSTLNPEEAIQLIHAVVHTHLYAFPESYRNDLEAVHEVDFLIRDHFMPQLRQLMSGEHRNLILSKILLKLTNTVQEGEWVSPDKFPNFISPQGDYELNVVDGTFKALTGVVIPFNNDFLRNTFMEEIFGGSPPKTMSRIDDDTILMQFKTGETYRLVNSQNIWSGQLQRQFGGQWYQLQEKTFTTRLDNKALLSGKHVWYAPSNKEGAVGSMILTDQDSKKVIYRAILEKKENNEKIQLQKVIKPDNQERDTDLILIDSNKDELDAFRRLEASDYMIAWAKDGYINQVNLPRFGLTFTIKEVDGRRQALADGFSGYVLQEGSKQYIPELGNLRHYLHLQRTESDGSISEKVVFARQPLKPYTQGSFLTNAEPNRDIGTDTTLNPQERIEYQLIKGELVPTTTNDQEAIEASLFLAMTHLAERHPTDSDKETNPYMRAHFYLEKANDQILRQREGLSLDTLEILRWIATQDTVTQDKHPDANILRLKAELMLQRNQLDFTDMSPSREEINILTKKIERTKSLSERLNANQKWKSEISNSIRTHYIEYLMHLKYVDVTLRLTQGEEISLLESLGIEDSRFAHRFRQLTNQFDSGDSELNVPIGISSRTLKGAVVTATFPKDWINTLLTPPPATSAQSIFLRDINAPNQFLKYYAIARGDMQGPECILELNQGMGLHLSSSLPRDKMLQEMRTALKMTLLANNRDDDWFTLTLLAVATDPTQFSLSSKELSTKIEALKKAKEQAKSISKERVEYRLSQNQNTIEYYSKEIMRAEKAGESENVKNFESKRITYQTIRDELTAELDVLKNIPVMELLFIESLQAPTITLRNQGALGLSLSTSSQVNKDSERLRREKELAKQSKIVVKKDLTFSECINLDALTGFPLSNRTLTNPVVPSQAMVQFIRTVPVQQTENPAAALFQGNPKNARIKELFAEAEKDLADYATKSLGNSKYEIIDPAKTIELCDVLRQNVTALQQDVLSQEIALLQFANRGPSRTGELAKRDLQIEQGTLKLLTLDELNRAFFQRDLEVLHKRNPNLSREEMSELFAKIENYLLDATHLQQERRVLKKAEALKKSQDDNLSDFTLQETIRAFVDAVGATRTYEPHEHPEYLVFEYYADILMWNLQVETLNSFGKKELRGALVELAMSLGKSSVIAPLLTWLAADGEQIASILTPEPLLPSMAKDLQETSGKVFAQKTRTIAIKREPITTARLQRLLDNLDEVRKERFALVWSASDILSLFNQWVELNEQAYESKTKGTWTPEMQKDLSDKRTLFLNNFKLLKESASLTVDEIHKVFDILQSHSFTFGSPKSVHADISSGIVRLIDAIISDKELFETIHWEFLEKSEGESFTEESYHENVKGKIIDSLIERGIAPDNMIYRDFFRDIAPLEKQQLKEYLADGAQASKGYHFLSNLEEEKGIDPTIAKKIRNELATLKETINHILPHTAGKKPLVHFGDDANGELVVPYHDGVPTVNSLFGSVLERLIYTVQYGLSQGISRDIVRKKIQQLKDNYETDRALGRNPDLSEFNRLVGGNKDRQFSLLKFKDKDYAEGKYEEIAKNINKNPEMILQLVAEYRLPSIKVYSKEIESSAHLIPLLAKEEQGIRGMSGTLFNVPTFPKIFQATKLSDTQAKTLQILLKNSNPKVATLPSTKGGNVADKIGIIDAHEVESGASLIDETGALSGMSNEEIARHMLKRLQTENSKIQGIVFYDGNIKKVITIKDKAPVVYRKDMDRESLAAFWDLSHITGSDIPVGPFMKANMIVGKHTTLVSLMQGGWRLRGLAKGQAVNFMVPEEDKLIICKMLKEHLDIDIAPNDDLTFPQLVSYAYLTQALQESENTYQAVKESMKVALIKQVSNIAWNEATSAEDAMQIYEDMRSLFIKEEAEEPWDRWGHPAQETPTSEALRKLLEDWKNNPIIIKIRANPELYKGLDLDVLFKSWDEIIEKINGPLPEKVKIGAQLYGKTTEQIAEQQVQQQQQQQQQVEQQVQQKVEKLVRLETGRSNLNPRQRVPVNNPFILKDAIPTPVEVLVNIPEDELSEVFRVDSEKPKETGLCVKVDELLQRNKATKEMYNIFDEDLLASLNLAPVQGLAKTPNTLKKDMWGRPTGSQMIYESFDKFQKPCSFVAVTQENGTGRLKLKLIDERDAGAIRNFLKKDRLEPVEKEGNVPKLRVGLYQLQKDSYVLDDVGSQPIDLEKPETHKRFMELLVQAKFAAGKVDFRPEELSYLEKWISKIGAIKAFELLKVILDPVAKGDTRKTFAKSSLAKIFEKQGVSRQTLASVS